MPQRSFSEPPQYSQIRKTKDPVDFEGDFLGYAELFWERPVH